MQHCFLLSRKSLRFLGSAMGIAIANRKNRCDFGALSVFSTESHAVVFYYSVVNLLRIVIPYSKYSKSVQNSEAWAPPQFQEVSVAISEVLEEARWQCHEMLAPHDVSIISAQNTSSMLKVKQRDICLHRRANRSKPLQTIEDRCRQCGQSARPLTCAIFLQIFYASNSSLFNACNPYVHEKKDTCCPSVSPVSPQTSCENCRN